MNMKRWTALFLTLVCILGLAGCDNRTMNYIIENEPSITGTVEEVRDNAIIININTQGYPNGASCKVSLDVENKDSYTDISVGDEIVVKVTEIDNKGRINLSRKAVLMKSVQK